MSAPQQEKPPASPPTFWQTVFSVGASFFGVQSSKNRKRDFSHGKPVHFIAIALGMVAVFVLVLVLVVKLALSQAGL